jgi:hypothetical protein
VLTDPHNVEVGNKQLEIVFFLKNLHTTKNREQEGKTGTVWGVSTRGRGKYVGKECKRVNMVGILCNHV